MEPGNPWKTYGIHIGLFIVSLLTTTLAGGEWMFGDYLILEDYQWSNFTAGFAFSIPFLSFLTMHEFGHYFVARYNNIKTTLPYFLPFWLGFLPAPSIGSFGAVIRIKQQIRTRMAYFDIGIAGPIAGFVAGLFILFYGFTNLPPAEYIFEIHPEYQQYGLDYADHVYGSAREEQGIAFVMGSNLLFDFFKEYVAPDPSLVPNPYEIAHYPWLLAGFLALLFTALNLLPIGQLDGGHVIYGLLGTKWHRRLSPAFLIVLIFYSGLGMITPAHLSGTLQFEPDMWWQGPLYFWFLMIVLYKVFPNVQLRLVWTLAIFAGQLLLSMSFNGIEGYSGWLLFAFLLGRVMGVHHPEPPVDQPLDFNRKLLGWLAILIFILCFTPAPLELVVLGE